ncbi:hypothetical protein ACFS7Z_24785 [Pontibacter toksunensis]|uniref:Uncharacterized protein n=1 Tax=Pontibacter toksunensis TaxID=1332631 RepID=A0ABW6C320_9BACT
MIKVKHPDEKYRKNQEEFLDSCPPEDRRFHALMFTYGNITYRYHLRSTEFIPSLQDYYEWLEGLPDDMRLAMRQLGFGVCKSAPSFTRYVMEKNDVGLEEYIRQHMDAEDYAAYKAMRKAI